MLWSFKFQEASMSRKKIILALTVLGFAASSGFAQETRLTGSVVKVDEPAGTVTIRLVSSGTVGANVPAGTNTEDYRLQDGLMFNALRFGEMVTFSVKSVDGVKIITDLRIN
jgi:Cu/Ag efflux protein CusF